MTTGMLNHCFDPENQMNLWLWSPLIVQLCAATRCGLNVNQILCSLLIHYKSNDCLSFYVAIQMSRMKVQMGWEFVLPYDLEFIQK